MSLVPLRDADSDERFGGKATWLARVLEKGVPVPPGIVLSRDVLTGFLT